jgi:hypothetical protein
MTAAVRPRQKRVIGGDRRRRGSGVSAAHALTAEGPFSWEMLTEREALLARPRFLCGRHGEGPARMRFFPDSGTPWEPALYGSPA